MVSGEWGVGSPELGGHGGWEKPVFCSVQVMSPMDEIFACITSGNEQFLPLFTEMDH